MLGMQKQQLLFTIAVTATSRVCLVRDRLLRKIPWDGRMATAPAGVTRHSIHCGGRVLDAVMVKPEYKAPQASVLLCHGIGETVEHWLVVQQLLATCGIASLVFDYTGYGRSTGFFRAPQAEDEAIAAFWFLERLTAPLPVSILGLSLGSGIAAAIVKRVPAHRLVLCAAFTSLRKASFRVGLPRALAFAVPPIWDAEESLRDSKVPVLLVTGENDRLFPPPMARELAGLCGPATELVIVPKVAHNEPFSRPRLTYWGAIVGQFLLKGGV